MRKNKIKIIFVVAAIAVIFAFVMVKIKGRESSSEIIKEISPVIGSIQTFVSSTGTVLPKNRLEVKPPVNGRVESIEVKEGDKVKAGEILVWMSSTERAALLDAARGQGEEALKYWKDVYKAIPLLSPIEGEVIVATTQPGQTVTASDAVIVLSDHLIVRAQVDETDIGKIMTEQKAVIALDAYPDTKIKAVVEHIYYESQTVNNVTIYNVDLLPEDVPLFFRSGMNANVDFLEKSKENILLIPAEAVHRGKDEAFVFLKQPNGKEPVKCIVQLGITDDKNFEVLSGVDINDKIIVKAKKYTLPSNTVANSPLTPFRQRRQ